MAHDILKLIAAVAILAVIVGLVALFASGYISAFKPGGVAGKSTNVTGGYGGTGGGGRAAAPAKSAQPNVTMPAMPSGAIPYGEAPPGYIEPQPTAYIQPQAYMRQPAGQLQAPGYGQEPQPPEYGQGLQPPGPQRNVTPTTEEQPQGRREIAPTSMPVAQPETPDMSQMSEEWQTIFDQLFEIISLIFSRQFEQYSCIPQWPAWTQYYPVSLK